jgi:ankyrin repeat protein
MTKQEQLNKKLIDASHHNNVDQVKELLRLGAEVWARRDYAVYLAAAHGHNDVVRVLVEAGADISRDNYSCLQLASYNGHVDVVLFLAQHAEFNKKKAQFFYDMIIDDSKQHQALLCALPLITKWM